MSQAYGNSRLTIEREMTLITDIIDPTQVSMKSGWLFWITASVT
jgi:hypothetical protein